MPAMIGQDVALARRIGMQGTVRPGMRFALTLPARRLVGRRLAALRGRRAGIVRRLRRQAKLGLQLRHPRRQPLDVPGQCSDRLRLLQNQMDQGFLVERLNRLTIHPILESTESPLVKA
jgi:hypothetical protein